MSNMSNIPDLLNLRVWVCFFFLLAGIISEIGGQTPENISDKISQWEYYRQGKKELIALLESPKEEIRQRSLRALGRRQDPSTIKVIAERMQDESIAVRKEAAFALGQMFDSKAQNYLLESLKTERKPQVLKMIIEALGKTGDERAIDALHQVLKRKNHSIHTQTAYSLGLLAYRNHKKKESVPLLLNILEGNTSERQAASYALMRMAFPSTEANLVNTLSDSDPLVRMNAARGLGNIKGGQKSLRKAFLDSDWRVVINAINALDSIQEQDSFETGLGLLFLAHHSNQHVRLSAIKALRKQKNPSFGEALLFCLSSKDPLVIKETLATLASLSPKIAQKRIAQYKDDPSHLVQIGRAEALGILGKDHLAELKKLCQSKDTRIAGAALESLAQVKDSRSIPIFREALRSGDIALTTYAAQGLVQQKAKSAVEDLIKVYQKLSFPEGVEPMQAIIEALGNLQSKKAESLLRKAIKAPHRPLAQAAAKAWKEISGEDLAHEICLNSEITTPFPQNMEVFSFPIYAHIETSRGNFIIELLSKDAPVAVNNFITLAEKGFYNNLSFHRVVPNFVVQGGDPRGDGWGGPGYVIPCENNFHRYGTGMVGMPLAGKDTGGCQLFITHSPQPHLNGRYTIFGQVTGGIEVLMKIQMGDRFIKVEIEK